MKRSRLLLIGFIVFTGCALGGSALAVADTVTPADDSVNVITQVANTEKLTSSQDKTLAKDYKHDHLSSAIASAVKAGKLSSSQATALKAELDRIHSEHSRDVSNATSKSDVVDSRAARANELQAWLSNQNISLGQLL